MKKILSIVLTVMLITTVIPLSEFSLDVSAAITTSEIQQKLQTKMTETGYKPGVSPPSSYLSGSGCYGFVDMLCRYLYGHQLPTQASNHYQFKNYSTNFTQIGSTLTISAGTLTESSLQNLFSQAKPGDVIQMDYTKYDGNDSLHTMMVYSISSSGVVFYHAGSSKVYWGASSGTQPLWGTTGNTLTWANFKAVLKSSDDGISLYRSKAVTVTSCTSHNYNDVGVCTNKGCGYQFPYNNNRNTSYAGTYKVKSGVTAYIRTGPYQACSETTHTTSGNFTVVARVLNCKGNYWYEISYNGSTRYIVSTSLEKVSHTHSYSYGYEAAHPHKQYKKCSSCGDYSYTGSTQMVSSCSTCYPPSSYGSTNPDDYPVPERSLTYNSSSATMTGDDVAWVQAVLYQLGYSVTIDGKYGPGTRDTIKLFQANNVDENGAKLTVDGSCGPKTRAALQREWNAKKHTHSYTQYSESAHPHNVYMQCSCGDTYYTGATQINWIGTSYESAHPHNIYKTCSCGYTEYTGGTQNLWTGTTYETAHPHKVYNACSCGYKEYTGDDTTDRYCYTCIDDSYVESIEYNGHTYVLYQINTPWQYAKTFCESKDGHLATITDETEWEFIKWFLEGKTTWLGGYLTPEQNWEWVTNEEFSFTDWLPGEPNNASGDEGYLGTYVDNKWNDFPNSAETVNYFLCEYEPLTYTTRVRYNNHTYDVYNKDVSWLEAYNICKEKGGHLVTVNDKSELAFLSGVIEGNVCWTAQYLDTIKSGLYFYYGVNPSTITTANIFICEYDPITITYDANGGENAPVAIEKAYEEDIVLNSAKPSREGYVFLGWSDKSDAEYVEYELGDNFKRNEDTILYAMWQELTNVTLDENLSASIYVDGDKTQYLEFTPTRSGNYTINSIGDEDTYVYLYDANMNLIATDDDSGENGNFSLEQYLESNKTYIYGVRFWDGTTGNLEFSIVSETKEPGDTNGDGNVNARDYAMLIQHLNGWTVTIDIDAADVNDDDTVNARDYAMLIQYLNGWDVKLA